MSRFVTRLARTLGRRQAERELNWMRQSAVSDAQLVRMVDRRTRGEPLQYILGTQPFGPFDIIVRPPVLIPRPETEQWTYTLADTIIRRLVVPSNHPQSLTVLDLCTGTGCIPLLLCTLLSLPGIQTEALGVDISPAACLLAQENIMSSQSRLSPLSSIRILQKDLFEPDFWSAVHSTFSAPNGRRSSPQLDVITANPPYIPARDWHRLSPEVKDWEDPVALLGDPTTTSAEGTLDAEDELRGLHFYRRIHHLISTCTTLSHSCILALEVGENQASAVASLFRDQFRTIEVWKDTWGKDKAVVCSMKPWRDQTYAACS